MSVSPERYIVDAKGKKKSVVLSVERYAQLIEDLHDLAVVAERRTVKAVSMEAMKRQLRKHGLG